MDPAGLIINNIKDVFTKHISGNGSVADLVSHKYIKSRKK